MKIHRAFVWFVLAVALAACGGQAAPASSTQAPTFRAPESEASAPPAAATADTAAPTTPESAPPMASPTAFLISPTFSPSLVPETPTATVTPVLPTETPVLAMATTPTLPPTASPTATLPPTVTPTASPTWVTILTATPSPTPTAALASTPYELGDPDMLDPMDVPGRSWYLWGNPYVVPVMDRPGFLGLTVPKTSDVTYWIRSAYPSLQDAYVQAVFKTGDVCNHKDRYGLLVRSPSEYDEGIFFVISCDGMYKIFRWNGGLKILHDWDRTPAIHTGRRQTNRVGVWMEGTTLRLFVNGAQVAEVQEDHFLEGTFGIAVGADATPGFTVYVDEVAYWKLPQPARK